MSSSDVLQMIGVSGLLALAGAGAYLGLNGRTPTLLKSHGLFVLSAYLVFVSTCIALSIFGLLGERDSRTVNLLASFLFVAFMAEILLDARAARMAAEKFEGFK